MTYVLDTPVLRERQTDDALWVTVSAHDWENIHRELHSAGAGRFEWLTATHQGGADFILTSCVVRADLSGRVIVQADAQSIATLTEVFPNADFYEREVEQMFGFTFTGVAHREPAFAADFGGHPLRRDFALVKRINTSWPGAVEPDENARRRPSLPPGVREEWTL